MDKSVIILVSEIQKITDRCDTRGVDCGNVLL